MSMDKSGQISRIEPISELQSRWIMEYLLDFKKTLSAKRVGITPQCVSQWLKKPEIVDEIQKQAARAVRQCQCNLEDVLIELHNIAMYDHNDAEYLKVSEDGELSVDLADLDKIDLSAIETVTAKQGIMGHKYLVVKPYNKLEALRLLLEFYKQSGAQKGIIPEVTEADMKAKSSKEIAAEYQTLLDS